MNIGQIARNQQMLYGLVNRNGSGSYSSKPSSLWDAGSGAEADGDNFFSSPAALQGTVRQIAKRLYDASFSSNAAPGENGVGFTQGSYTTGEDQTLKAIRERLGAKVGSMQQLYQPDQTTLSGNFAQLQAVAEDLVSRLQTVSLSDETTKRIQELALRDAKNSAGARENGETAANTSALSQKDRLSMIQEEVQKFSPSKRAAAFNTINKVWESELDRIGAYIKEKDPNWTTWGDKFDTGILDDYKAGVNMWA